MQDETTMLTSDAQLPVLPVNSPEFWADPERYLAPARLRHPWLARFADGYIVHGRQANEDLFAEHARLYMGLDALVDFYGAQGTPWAGFMTDMINSRRGADHARIRGSIAAAFTPRQANRMRPVIRDVIHALLDEWAPRGSFDFAEFAANFPIGVICALLGVSADPIPRLRQSLDAQLKAIAMDKSAMPEFMAGHDTIWNFADELVRQREAGGPADAESLLDSLLAARDSGRLDERELRHLIMVLLFGGYDTSRNMLTMTMHLLLDRPEIYAGCAQSLTYCGQVVQEALRHSSIATPVRQVQQSFVYDGFRFPQGAIVYLAAPLAGRDPAAFSNAMAFDPDRVAESRHVAFGRGPHICIGQFLARTLLEEGIHAIAGRIVNPRRAGAIGWRPMLGAWGLTTLPIAFGPA